MATKTTPLEMRSLSLLWSQGTAGWLAGWQVGRLQEYSDTKGKNRQQSYKKAVITKKQKAFVCVKDFFAMT